MLSYQFSDELASFHFVFPRPFLFLSNFPLTRHKRGPLSQRMAVTPEASSVLSSVLLSVASGSKYSAPLCLLLLDSRTFAPPGCRVKL